MPGKPIQMVVLLLAFGVISLLAVQKPRNLKAIGFTTLIAIAAALWLFGRGWMALFAIFICLFWTGLSLSFADAKKAKNSSSQPSGKDSKNS